MTNLTFGQRIGAEPLPTQLRPTEISPQLASMLWAIIYESLERFRSSSHYGIIISGFWRTIMWNWHVGQMHIPSDEYKDTFSLNKDIIKSIIFSKDYLRVFNFIQFVIDNPRCPEQLVSDIGAILEVSRSAYRIVESSIVPVASNEDATAIKAAFVIASAHEAKGPRSHLGSAAAALTAGSWSNAIRESIAAVESAAKVVEPSADTLGPALAALERAQVINPALKKAFSALYGFASDEQGIRHALVFDGQAAVGEADALFMFGACAAFVSYLLSPRA